MSEKYLNYPYPSQRMCCFAKNGMVATSQPLAAQAGLGILQQGGNAIDAAIATAACLTVVEPTSNGLGGDAFAIIWTRGQLYGLNASGKSPINLSIDTLKERGYKEMPATGWLPVTVPGAPSAWSELSRRFGSLPFEKVLQPAINYAENGYPISPVLGKYWQKAFEIYRQKLTDSLFQSWFTTFAPEGRAPRIGELWHSPDHARTLKLIASTEGESFYRGELAEKIINFSRESGGFFIEEDFTSHSPEWVEPINIDYRDYQIWELPPNGQGLIALLALNILKEFDFKAKDTDDTYHKQIEALKLAFADGKKYITDPADMPVKIEELLSPEYTEERRKQIGETALSPKAGTPPRSGTVYLATADSEGNMVSYIQSNYMGFGSGLVVPGTGIALQNRGHSFSLNPEETNSLKPGKRPYHTIIPGFITRNNQAIGPFGVMGGFMQPQGHLQVIMNMLDFDLNPQAALDAPRWQWTEEKNIIVEPHFPTHIAQALARRGHKVTIALDSGSFGRGQIILRDHKTGVLIGGTEPRTDSAIAAW